MTTFRLFLSLGIHHISDLSGYDHILFLVALCAVYSLKQWRQILILVTAFTLGHTLTLVLATFDLIRISSDYVELLIPVTIFITGFLNLFQRSERIGRKVQFAKYFIALFFGLIHGLGFSNYLRALLDAEEVIAVPLFGFNIGLEVGQAIIVLVVLIVSFILIHFFRVQRREWNLLLSGAAIGVSLILIMENLPRGW